MGLIVILIVFGLVMFFLFKRTAYTKENEIEVLEEDKSNLPDRALVKTDVLFRLVERDMEMGRTNKIIFFYHLNEHHIGVEILNDKLIFNYDDKLYQTMNELKNIALLETRRIADCDDLVTVTEIKYPDTKIEAILANEPLLKDSIVHGVDKDYDLNLVEVKKYE